MRLPEVDSVIDFVKITSEQHMKITKCSAYQQKLSNCQNKYTPPHKFSKTGKYGYLKEKYKT